MKVKEQMQKQQEKAFQEELSFAQWLDHSMDEPSNEELDAMQKEFKTKKLYRLRPSNNTYYYPLQGA